MNDSADGRECDDHEREMMQRSNLLLLLMMSFPFLVGVKEFWIDGRTCGIACALIEMTVAFAWVGLGLI